MSEEARGAALSQMGTEESAIAEAAAVMEMARAAIEPTSWFQAGIVGKWRFSLLSASSFGVFGVWTLSYIRCLVIRCFVLLVSWVLALLADTSMLPNMSIYSHCFRIW